MIDLIVVVGNSVRLEDVSKLTAKHFEEQSICKLCEEHKKYRKFDEGLIFLQFALRKLP